MNGSLFVMRNNTKTSISRNKEDSKAEYSTKYCPNKNELNTIRYARQMQ